MGKMFYMAKMKLQYQLFYNLKFFQVIDWLAVTICCSRKKFAHKQSYKLFHVLHSLLEAMGNTGSFAEVITNLETPLVGVKTKSCWTRNNNNDKISSQMFHQPPVVALARLSSDTTRNRPAHRSL